MQACRDPLRNALNNLEKVAPSHPGLLLSRYLEHQKVEDGDGEDAIHARKQLLDAAIKAAFQARGVYRLAFDRWRQTLPQEPGPREWNVEGRLIVGLGGENVLETGLTLHHTYGVPFIPGSAIKGLAAHYAAQVWGLGDSKWVHDSEKGQQGEYHRIVFGDQSEAGFITFWDAWITPDSLKEDGSSGLVLDVMTPHHQDYNMGKTYSDGPRQGQLIPPTGFDNPVPVSFLSVAGTFLVGVSCDDTGEEGRKCARLALDLIGEALENWGIGGKTSSGYGRMKFNKKEPTTGIQGENEIRSPKYKRGMEINVVRIEEKGKIKFRADDQFVGHFINEDFPKEGNFKTWVANVNSCGYTFTMKKPVVKKKQERKK